MKNVQRLWMRVGQPAILSMISIVLLMSILFFRLGTLVTPFTGAEHAARASSAQLNNIVDNPVHAPHKIGQNVLQKVGRKGPLAMRSVSAVMGVIAVILFFFVARIWFKTDLALMGTVLFASSTYFLHTARAATPHILLPAALLGLVVCGKWLRYSNRRSIALLACGFVATICLYLPGMVWFVVFFLFLQRKILMQALKHTPAPVIIMTFFAGLALLAPLIIGVIGDPKILRILAGFPDGQLNLTAAGRNLAEVPLQLFVRGPDNAGNWLGRLPVLDLFSGVMFILGSYRIIFERKLDRTKLIMMVLVIGLLLAAIGGEASLALLLPFIYIVITHGIAHFLRQWYTVFPRNPFARYSGLLLLTTAFILCVVYNTSRYFVAWPGAPATRQAHNRVP